MTTAIVVAAGKASRMGDVDKAFLTLGSRPVVAHALAAFERCPDVTEVVLVVRKDQLSAADSAVRMFGLRKVRRIVPGGEHCEACWEEQIPFFMPILFYDRE